MKRRVISEGSKKKVRITSNGDSHDIHVFIGGVDIIEECNIATLDIHFGPERDIAKITIVIDDFVEFDIEADDLLARVQEKLKEKDVR